MSRPRLACIEALFRRHGSLGMLFGCPLFCLGRKNESLGKAVNAVTVVFMLIHEQAQYLMTSWRITKLTLCKPQIKILNPVSCSIFPKRRTVNWTH